MDSESKSALIWGVVLYFGIPLAFELLDSWHKLGIAKKAGEVLLAIWVGLAILAGLGWLAGRVGLLQVVRARRGLFLTLAIIVAVCAAVDIDIYRQIDVKMAEKAKETLRPTPDPSNVWETGYIYHVRTEMNFSERRREIWWSVKIPATDQTYYCRWQSGYPDFAKNDGVILVHKQDEACASSGDCSGFIVGLHGSQRGHATSVSAVNEQDIDDYTP